MNDIFSLLKMLSSGGGTPTNAYPGTPPLNPHPKSYDESGIEPHPQGGSWMDSVGANSNFIQDFILGNLERSAMDQIRQGYGMQSQSAQMMPPRPEHVAFRSSDILPGALAILGGLALDRGRGAGNAAMGFLGGKQNFTDTQNQNAQNQFEATQRGQYAQGQNQVQMGRLGLDEARQRRSDAVEDRRYESQIQRQNAQDAFQREKFAYERSMDEAEALRRQQLANSAVEQKDAERQAKDIERLEKAFFEGKTKAARRAALKELHARQKFYGAEIENALLNSSLDEIDQQAITEARNARQERDAAMFPLQKENLESQISTRKADDARADERLRLDQETAANKGNAPMDPLEYLIQAPKAGKVAGGMIGSGMPPVGSGSTLKGQIGSGNPAPSISEARKQAQAAIKAGKDPVAVRKRFKEIYNKEL